MVLPRSYRRFSSQLESLTEADADLRHTSADRVCRSQSVHCCATIIAMVSRAEKEPMAKKSPWHSINQTVHHNDTQCTEGNNIEAENRRDGTGGKPLCSHCERL